MKLILIPIKGFPRQQSTQGTVNLQVPFNLARSLGQVVIPPSQSPNLSALHSLADLALGEQGAINLNSPSLQPSASSASSAEPGQKRLRD
jgi:hypothetical protein